MLNIILANFTLKKFMRLLPISDLFDFRINDETIKF